MLNTKAALAGLCGAALLLALSIGTAGAVAESGTQGAISAMQTGAHADDDEWGVTHP